MADEASSPEPGSTDEADDVRAADRSAVLVGAVCAVVAPVCATMVLVWVTALAHGGPVESLLAVVEDPVFLAIVASIAMTAVHLLGVPLALLLERRLRGRPRARWSVYGSAGAVVGAAVGGLLFGSSPGALAMVGYGLVSALGGAAGVGWARRRPVVRNRRLGYRTTTAASALALVAWLVSGAVVVPLLTGAVAAAGALLMLVPRSRHPRSLHRRGPAN